MARQPEPRPSFFRRIDNLEKAVRLLQNRSPFAGTGLSIPDDGTTQVDGDLHVLGSLTADGKINNDALVNPVIPGIARLSASAFSLSTSYATLDSSTLTVPDSCTKLFVTVLARLYVVNTNTTGGGDGFGLEAIYVKGIIGGNASVASPTGVSGSNGFATTFGNDAFLISGLTPGGTVSFAVQGKCAYSGIPSYADNFVVATAALSWSR